MGKFLLILLIFISDTLYSQDSTFSELRGFDDKFGNTHLYYRIETWGREGHRNWTDNSIYHYDAANNTDSLFLRDNSVCEHEIIDCSSININDYTFWENDPQKFIYSVTQCGMDCDWHISRYDHEYVTGGYGGQAHLFLSKQNQNLVFAESGWTASKSTDGGFRWEEFLQDTKIVSISPFNDGIFFGINYHGIFVYTEDMGNTFSVSESISLDHPQLFYDQDRKHIYLLDKNVVRMSDNSGKENSWRIIFETEDLKFTNVCVDSVSGSIFITNGKNIYHSTDYGITFNLFKSIDGNIIGIYKKPYSNIIYIATEYQIIELQGSTASIVKQLKPLQNLSFPLAIGNRWDFEEQIWDMVHGSIDTLSIIITGDTLMPNGKRYFRLTQVANFFDFIRYDSIGIYYYDTENMKEWLYYRFNLGVCKNYPYCNYDIAGYFKIVKVSDYEDYMFGDSIRIIKYSADTGIDLSYSVTISPQLGFIGSDWPGQFDNQTDRLIGCRLSGIVYGTLTSVNENNPVKINRFSLSQNYPNPFNPTTTINYSVPERTFIQIKLYDSIGREVADLLNEEKEAGEYKLLFDASRLPSGVYFYRMSGKYNQTRKMVILK